ncbi:nSTAND1 domain-containing NTPase [Streptomyces sp. 8N706]|uniref:nSTAND1 domain-containing NTPase n=1 Tax=Streptomyces sp. 8N706 TaxID=3457416 RepID=UPI003FD4DBA9
MGRREKQVDPAAGPVQRFAFELRTLRQEAGAPTYRVMAQRAGYSAAALATAAGGKRLPTLAVTLGYVNACGGDAEEWERRWHAAAQDEAALPADEDEAEPPYRGLARFEADDQDRFFGRDQLTDALLQLVRKHRLVAVFGPSGSGKSSLLRAGLIPRLQNATDPALRPATIRILTPGSRPLHTCEQIFESADGEGETWLVVDQFEEVFTLYHDPDERNLFINRLLAARAPARRLRVVLGVRADFYSRCLQHRQLAEAVRDASMPVVPMSPAELREAIVKPAAAHGLIVERSLTARLVEETADEPGGLPLMSHALLETWRRRRARTLTMDAYEASGEVTGALARTAEDLYTQLPDEHACLARRILLRLITPGDGVPDTRRPIQRAELDTGDTAGTAHVLDRLARARLITLYHDTVDLAHEAVIIGWPRLHAWIEDDRERLRCHRRLTEAAQTWQELDRDPGALYRGTRLATAEEHFPHAHDHHDLTNLERAFLTASVTARVQEQQAAARVTRRLRRFTVALSVLLVLALIAGLTAWQQSRTSSRERDRALTAQRVALSRQLAAQSTGLLDSEPDLASLLAVQAYRTAPTPEATTSLYSAADLPIQDRLTGHTQLVRAVAFSPDGRTLATGSKDQTVRLWNVATGKLRTRFTGHTKSVAAVAFSPDGRTLATGSGDKTVRLWNMATGKLQARFTGHTGEVTAVAFSPNGRTLATGSDDKTVRLWNMATGKLQATLTGHTNDINAVAFSANGRTLATGSDDKTVRLWDVGARKTRTTLSGHTREVTAVAFNPDGQTLATSSQDKTVRLWNVATGKLRVKFTGHTDDIYAVAFSPDGRTLAIANYSAVRLRNVATGKTRATLTGHTGPIYAMAFSPDGQTLATGSHDNTVRLWDFDARKARTTLTGHTDVVSAVAFSRDGRTLATGSWDKTVRLWDVGARKTRTTLTGHTGPIYAMAFSPDGQTLATGSADKTVRLWNGATGKLQATLTGHTNDIFVMAFSPDGRTLATGSADKTVRLWNGATGKLQATLTGHTGEVTAVAFSPDGRTLATGSDDKTVRLWDVGARKTRTTLTGHTDVVSAVAFSRDGRTLVTGSWDKTVRLWDVGARKTRTTLTGHTSEVSSVAFSPDGRTLATGSDDRTVQLWDTRTRHPRTALTGYANTVAAVEFSPDGRTLATANYDKTVWLWKLDLPTPDESIRKICHAIHRNLTPLERSTYLPAHPPRPICAPR